MAYQRVSVDERVMLSINVVRFSLRIERYKRAGSKKSIFLFLVASGTAGHAREKTRKNIISFCM